MCSNFAAKNEEWYLGKDQNGDEEWPEAAAEIIAQIEHRQRRPPCFCGQK